MAGCAFNPYFSMVKVNDAFADGQADTGAIGTTAGGIFYLLKFFENFTLIFDSYPDAVILDIHLDLSGIGRQPDGDFTAIGVTEFNRI